MNEFNVLTGKPFGLRSSRAWAAALLLGLPVQAWSTGQQAPTERLQSQQPYTLHQRVEEVLLYCTVIGRKGKAKQGLRQANFSVLEDGNNVAITHFADDDVPVSISLVIDDSTSMKDKRELLQSTVTALLKASNPEDESSVTNFADRAYVDQPLTQDMSALQVALAKNKTISGGTALFDTLIAAADRLSENAHRKKQIIIVMTDGKDNASEATVVDAIRRVQRTDGPVIYAIGLLYDLPGPQARRSRKDLSMLTDQTGGVAYFPSSASESDHVAEQVADDIRHQYTIAFHPSRSATGSYHSLIVRASLPGTRGLTVRTRKGYLRRSDAEESSSK